ncbi:MAG: rod shape-determining protein MreD [Magnetococcales bacterium]|nr:rod shape-determining protein MreD [Magnetococcales bacterium]
MFSFLTPWLPALTVFLAAAVQELAAPWPGWGILRPDLVSICLFYWRLYRPDRCGAPLAFAGGLSLDILSGLPLGMNAFSKILLVLLTGTVRRRLRSADFFLLLPVLLLLIGLEEWVQWGVAMLLQGDHARWPMLVGRPIATVLAAPLVVAGLIGLHRRFLEDA